MLFKLNFLINLRCLIKNVLINSYVNVSTVPITAVIVLEADADPHCTVKS